MFNQRFKCLIGSACLLAASCHASSLSAAQNWQTGLGSLSLNGGLSCADKDDISVNRLNETLLQVKGHNSCRANHVIPYSLNGTDFKTAADTFGNFHFFVSLSTTTNRLDLATLDGGSDLIFSSGLEEDISSPRSGLVLQPASLIIDSEQPTVSIVEPKLTDLTETGLDLLEDKAEAQVKLVANAFSVENSTEGLQPLPFADAPLSLDRPAQESKLLVEPVKATSTETPAEEESIVEDVSEPDIDQPALIEEEPLKLEFGKAEVANLTSPTTPAAKPALIPENEEVKIELVWTAPVDLDLHVFEPGFKGNPSARAKSPFHKFHKADVEGFFKTTAPKSEADNKRYTEVYRRSIKDLKKGALKLSLSYKDRSAGLPDTCGTGRFAAIPALAKIKTPGFKRSELVLINPVSCDSLDENATLLIDIADITLD